MKFYQRPNREEGAVLVVGLIMLVLITLMVTTAFRFSSTNLKAVNNMQSRTEAIAAANKAMEQVVGSWDFSTPPSADQISVDIDNNGTNDYVVNIATPVCMRATPASVPGGADSECPTNAEGLTICAPVTSNVYNVVWDLDATATGISGTRVRIRQGISKSISQAQCNAACPPAPGSPCV